MFSTSKCVACLYFEMLAEAFGVDLKVVRAPQLKSHRQVRYGLESGTLEEIVSALSLPT